MPTPHPGPSPDHQSDHPHRPPAHPHPVGEHHHHHSSRFHDPHHQELLAQWRREHDARNRVVIRNGLLWLGGTFVVMAIAGWFWADALERRQAEREGVHAARAALRAELMDPAGLEPDRVPDLLQRIDSTRAQWRDTPDAALIERRADQARAVLAVEQTRRSVRNDLDNLEQALQSPTKVLDTWRQLHDRERGIRSRLPERSADLQLRLDELADQIDGGWIDALLAEASAPGADSRQSLHLLTAAADLTEDNLAADHSDPGHQLFWRQRARHVVSRLDVAQTAACDTAAIAAAVWQELLPGSTEADWVPSRGSNLLKAAGGDTLRLHCQGEAGGRSVVVRLRAEPWHAALLSFDLQLDAGKAALFGRATREFDARTGGALLLATAAEPGAVEIPIGRPIGIQLSLIGDRMVADIGTAPPQRLEQRISHQERRGTFSLVLQPDTKVVLRKLRVKRLG